MPLYLGEKLISGGGTPGPRGESGVYVGTEKPTDPDIHVWINPNGQASNITGDGVGITQEQINALDGLFKITAYTMDASSAYAAFTKAFKIGGSGGGSEEPSGDRYSVTNNLTNVTNDSSITSVEKGSGYTANLTIADGCLLSKLTITMGGIDITDSVYGEGYILIPEVTGNVVITAVAVEPKLVETSGVGGQYVTMYSGADNTTPSVVTGTFDGTASTRRTESDVKLKVRITNTTESDITKNVYCGMLTSLQMLDCKYLRMIHTIKVSTTTFRAGQTVEFDYTLFAGHHICVTTETGLEVEIIGALDIYEPVNDFEYVTTAQGAKVYSDDGETVLYEKWDNVINWVTEPVVEDTPVRVVVKAALSNGRVICVGSGDYVADSKKLYNATKYNTTGMNENIPVIIDYIIPAGKYLGVSAIKVADFVVDKM